MLTIWERYLLAALLRACGLAFLIFLSLAFFILLMEELAEIKPGYGLTEAVKYALLATPRWAMELFPATAVLGVLLGWGALAQHGELLALRAAGVSLGQFRSLLTKVAVILAIGVFLLGETVLPWAEQQAAALKARAQAEGPTLLSKHGFWARQGDELLHVQQVLPDQQLYDVRRYQLDRAQRLQYVAQAQRVDYTATQWQAQTVAETWLRPERTTARLQVQALWPPLIAPELLAVLAVEPHTLSLGGLTRYITFLQASHLNATAYQVAWWRKLTLPLVLLLMLWLGVPFVLGSLRQVGLGQRILAGAALGIGFALLGQLALRIGQVYALSPLLAALAPLLLLVLVVSWLDRRV